MHSQVVLFALKCFFPVCYPELLFAVVLSLVKIGPGIRYVRLFCKSKISRYLETKRVSYFSPSMLLPQSLLLLLLLLLPPPSQFISTSAPTLSALQLLPSVLPLPDEHLHRSITTF